LFAVESYAAGLLTPADGSLPALDLREHHVAVVIEDGYAITTVEQVFHNPHAQDLEAIYSFPVPERGAVAEFAMWIDGKPVIGEVAEKKRAREIYEQEKAAGREAGVTEKDSYKTFDIRVAPVRAGQDQRVKLTYLQPAHVDTGIGRYVYPLEEGGVDEEKLAFWTANEKVSQRFSFDLRIRSAYPVDAVRAASHPQAVVQQVGAGEWSVKLDSAASAQPLAGDKEGGQQAREPPAGGCRVHANRTWWYWRHQPTGSVDFAQPDAGGRHLHAVVTRARTSSPSPRAADWVFSSTCPAGCRASLTLADGEAGPGKMRPEDRFRIVVANSSRELTSGFVNATPEAVRQWSDQVAAIRPEGGTNLFAGMQQGLGSLQSDRTSAVVLVTDGVANVGETEHRKFIELVRSRDVRLFTFIMGNSANRPLLEPMTRASGGFAISVSNSDDIVGQLLTATGKLTHEALHGVKLEISGIKTAELTPVLPG
jgi:Ca-activated chloride channel family protein